MSVVLKSHNPITLNAITGLDFFTSRLMFDLSIYLLYKKTNSSTTQDGI